MIKFNVLKINCGLLPIGHTYYKINSTIHGHGCMTRWEGHPEIKISTNLFISQKYESISISLTRIKHLDNNYMC